VPLPRRLYIISMDVRYTSFNIENKTAEQITFTKSDNHNHKPKMAHLN